MALISKEALGSNVFDPANVWPLLYKGLLRREGVVLTDLRQCSQLSLANRVYDSG